MMQCGHLESRQSTDFCITRRFLSQSEKELRLDPLEDQWRSGVAGDPRLTARQGSSFNSCKPFISWVFNVSAKAQLGGQRLERDKCGKKCVNYQSILCDADLTQSVISSPWLAACWILHFHNGDPSGVFVARHHHGDSSCSWLFLLEQTASTSETILEAFVPTTPANLSFICNYLITQALWCDPAISFLPPTPILMALQALRY